MFERFTRLLRELDGNLNEHRREVTEACLEALFDRVMNPPMLDTEQPALEDVDTAERLLIGMIKNEAAKMRDLLENRPPHPPGAL